jgi:putative membrane protein
VVVGWDFGGFGLVALVGFVVWLVFAVGLVVLIVLAIRWLLRSLNSPQTSSLGGSVASSEDAALRVLRERFARGEIDTDEFEQKRRTLGG